MAILPSISGGECFLRVPKTSLQVHALQVSTLVNYDRVCPDGK